MSHIRLFTTAFPDRDPARRAEFAECLLRNIGCPEIDEVCVLVEGNSELPGSPKVVARHIEGRPAYADYFRWIEELAEHDDISVIANADIYFDDQIGLFRLWTIPKRTVLAFSRWDITQQGSVLLNDRNDSQDAWVFRGRPDAIAGDFPIGVPRCDNRIAKELETAGYRILNPSFSIRSYHLHASRRDEYPVEQQADFVDGPYGYVWPHNLLPFHRTFWHNIRHGKYRIYWRFDRRYWRRRLKAHWFARKLEILLGVTRSLGHR